jgi:hypothetical protein
MVRTGAVVIDVGINRLPDGKLAGEPIRSTSCERWLQHLSIAGARERLAQAARR